MRNMSFLKRWYFIFFLVCVCVVSAGTTYAYLAATTQSGEDSVKAQSTIYSINMKISSLYSDFSFIPMNDFDAVKALRNGCKDKYDRGACSAYKISVFGYDETLNFISGYMDVFTDNMTNLSYMLYKESDTYDEESCVSIEEKNYCIVLNASPINDGVGLTLGDKYDVYGTTSTEFILLFWLSNLDVSQNHTDIGSFNASVTMQAGNGGQIKGTISSVVDVQPPLEDIEDPKVDDEVVDNTNDNLEGLDG